MSAHTSTWCMHRSNFSSLCSKSRSATTGHTRQVISSCACHVAYAEMRSSHHCACDEVRGAHDPVWRNYIRLRRPPEAMHVSVSTLHSLFSA